MVPLETSSREAIPGRAESNNAAWALFAIARLGLRPRFRFFIAEKGISNANGDK
ncbi:MAG TPA: hypothetical protein VFO40_29715 [Chthoniobacterales bacterium]|nr:hypothetical protein [Chthoniobacterales bacterium]